MPKPLPAHLTLTTRRALPRDVPSIATILASAPDDGSVYQYPTYFEHPEEWKQLHREWLGPDMYNPTHLMRVAVVRQEGSEDETIVGFSSWGKRVPDGHSGKTKAGNIWESWGEVIDLTPPAAAEPTQESKLDTSKAMEYEEMHHDAVRRNLAKQESLSPTQSTPCYQLTGLSIRPEYQGYGIASLLVRWGLERAAEEGLPVFTAGETQGVDFYEKALGFHKIKGSEYWLDEEGRDISDEEVASGNEAWKSENGGVSGAEMVWCPKGYKLEVRGDVYLGNLME
ncbi:acyl-n-acyltransferase [Podospora aff. communis PSN243]|uniref:Acyl-n-acyltransferase n=1 Tax=Podospora aff. communis PSN243 TaxID=3040156 RepID=A0AAV9GCE5_9PEZI|nr:acyl-n-acyltransferase [Podospora aff. communis PSN243]